MKLKKAFFCVAFLSRCRGAFQKMTVLAKTIIQGIVIMRKILP